MPEVFDDNVQLGARPLPIHEATEEPKKDRSFLEVLGAASSLDNSIFSTINAVQGGALVNPSGEIDESYDPFETAKARGVDSEHWDKYIYANSDKEFDRIQKRFEREEANRRIVAEAGGYGVAASILAGVSDPINLIPFGKSIQIGKGAGIVKGAINTAKVGAISVAASEAVLQSTQLNRSALESTVNIAGGTAIAGLLGAGALGIAKALGKGDDTAELGESLIKGLNEPLNLPDIPVEQAIMGGHSVGAAEAPPKTTLAQESLVSNPAYALIEKTTGQLSPMIRAMNSPLRSIRDITQRLVEVPQLLEKNKEGIATPQAAATNVKRHQAFLAKAIESGRTEFKAYKKTLNGEKGMNHNQFMEEVGKAFTRGDAHSNPFVQKAAQRFRKELYDVEAQEAVAVGFKFDDIPEHVADSYRNRVWNRAKVIQEEPRFREIVRGWAYRVYENELAAARLTVEEGTPKKAEAADTALRTRFNEELDPSAVDDYIEEITTNVLNRIKGFEQDTGFLNIKPTNRGPLKERTFHIPDELVFDFLENNIEKLAKRYSRIMSAEIELKRAFGTTRFDDLVGEINKDYNDTIKGITDPKELTAIEKLRSAGIRDLAAMWDLVRGTYRASNSRPDDIIKRGLAFTRTYKYVTSLGGVVASSISDVAMPVFVHGFSRVFGDAIVPLVKKFSSPEYAKITSMSKATSRRAGLVCEAYLHARQSAIYAIGDPFANGTALERFMSHLGEGFGKVTGLDWWNDSMKGISSMISQSRLLDGVTSGKISQRDDLWLNEIGIDRQMRKRIADQFAKHGEEIEGHKLANENLWDDEHAQRALYNALLKDVDRTIITKGTGDVPLFAESDVGKTITQFMSFAMAANQRVLMSGLQRMDAQVLQGFAGLMGMGMLTYVFKTLEKGDKISTDPLVWIQEGVDRSGIVALPFWVNNKVLEPAGFGVSNVTGVRPSRLSTQHAVVDLFGPTAGLLVDSFYTSRMVSDLAVGGKVTSGDVEAARRLIPYQNLIGIRWLFDAAEDGLRNTLGVKKKEKNRGIK